MSDRFFTPQPLSPGEFVLDGPEAHHVSTVRRFEAGDPIVLFNGDGAEYAAEIVAVSRKQVVVNIVAVHNVSRELDRELIVATAIPKADRGDYLVEKLTELGVTRLIPLITTRSVVTPKASSIEKYQRGVIEASKQCGRNQLMQVDHPTKWSDFLHHDYTADLRLMLHTQPSTTDTPSYQLASLAPVRRLLVAIGPEGGFTTEEVQSAVQAGFGLASCGSRVLRTETAATAVAAWFGIQSTGDQ